MENQDAVAGIRPTDWNTAPSISSLGDTLDWFERQPTSQVQCGYFDTLRIIDQTGTEYAVKLVFVSDYPWWQRLPLVGIRGVCQVDLALDPIATFSVENLNNRLMSYLCAYPGWWWAGEGQFDETEASKRFGRSTTIKGVIEAIGYHHAHSPEPITGTSQKIVDLR